MYQVYKDGEPMGKPFAQKQDAEDYAKSVGGKVGLPKQTQGQDPEQSQQKLTQ